MRIPVLTLVLTALVGRAAPFPRLDPPVKLAVLSIDLNNLHKTPPDSSMPGRIQRLGTALRTRLATTCGYDVVPVDTAAEAAAHLTDDYFYEHPDIAAALGRQAGAEWVVIPRLNRATAWAADLQAHVVRVKDSMVVSNRIVELKGLELAPELAARLIERGAAWMADQLDQVLERAGHPAGPWPRHCSASAS